MAARWRLSLSLSAPTLAADDVRIAASTRFAYGRERSRENAMSLPLIWVISWVGYPATAADLKSAALLT
jgi:hypothetical protein